MAEVFEWKALRIVSLAGRYEGVLGEGSLLASEGGARCFHSLRSAEVDIDRTCEDQSSRDDCHDGSRRPARSIAFWSR